MIGEKAADMIRAGRARRLTLASRTPDDAARYASADDQIHFWQTSTGDKPDRTS